MTTPKDKVSRGGLGPGSAGAGGSATGGRDSGGGVGVGMSEEVLAFSAPCRTSAMQGIVCLDVSANGGC